MLPRPRTVVLFLALATLFAGAGFQLYQLYQAAEQQHANATYQPASKPGFRIGAATKAPTEHYKPSCHNPNTREDADLCAQWAAVEQVAETNRLTSLNNRLTILSFFATIVATIALVLTLLDSIQTSRRQLRAYISLKEGSYAQITADRRQSGKITLLNTGQTPARNLRAVSVMVVQPADWDTVTNEPDFEGCGVSYVGAGTPFDLVGQTEDDLDREEYVEIGLELKKLFFIAVGEFEDVFGKRHTFRFVLESSPNIGETSFRPCAKGNNAT